MEKEQFHFFWDGPLSQWYSSYFVIDGVAYNCAEQYMMAQKALTFKDYVSHDKIMASQSPRDQKAIGRNVKLFNADKWRELSYDVVKRGNLAKFSQDQILLNYLLVTGDKTIVEASPYDTVWGIGIGENDPKRFDRNKWRGENRLGLVLMDVRGILRQ